MTEPTGGDASMWATLAAGIAGIGAALGKAFKNGHEIAAVRARTDELEDQQNVTIGRVIALETQGTEIQRRLEAIEEGQGRMHDENRRRLETMTQKLDRLLDRR